LGIIFRRGGIAIWINGLKEPARGRVARISAGMTGEIQHFSNNRTGARALPMR
jgi:hypothetical protein